MRRRFVGLLLVGLAAALGAGFARHESPLVRTAVTVAATLVLVAGAALVARRPSGDDPGS